MQTVTLPCGELLPALGLGTWRMGEVAPERAAEVAAVRLALELGYRVIDTAEMYGEGGAEQMLGQALAEALRVGTVSRDELFIVSKVYPHNASRAGVVAACERSLKRLKLGHIDLYLLHWRGPHPLADTVAGFEDLRSRGIIRHWGVSNFDRSDMTELFALPGGSACASNQIFYALSERGPEFELLPWQRQRSMPLMAYCPIDQGALATHAVLRRIGARHDASAAQVALGWVLSQPDVMAIPKAVNEVHLRQNMAACALRLTAADCAELDRQFVPPKHKTDLAMR
jgi:diketogulonate reductase-like aldo/keto reductase